MTTSTPSSSNIKKRDLSSPEELVLPKKCKSLLESSVTFESSDLPDSILMAEAMTNISLDASTIQAIALALKDTIQSNLQVMIDASIKPIVDGVVHGLQIRIDTLELDNKALKDQNTKLLDRVVELESSSESAEQYSRRNCLRLSGVPESLGEDPDQLVMDVSDAVGAGLSIQEIDRCHRIGRRRPDGKPRQIIVKFATYRSRQKLYSNRTRLRTSDHKGVFVNEDLTRNRSELLFQARQLVKSRKLLGAWSTDGSVLVKVNDGSIRRINSRKDMSGAVASDVRQ